MGTRFLLFVGYYLNVLVLDIVSNLGGVDVMVKVGVDWVLSMQTLSGGLGYWFGVSRPSVWGIVYVIYMFLDAKERGFVVFCDWLKEILFWIGREVDRCDIGGRLYFETMVYLYYVLV